MSLLQALGLTPAVPPGAANAPARQPESGPPPSAASGGGTKSPAMQTLLTRFQLAMVRIRTLDAARTPEAPALKQAAIDAGNLSTSAQGVVLANEALAKVEAQLDAVERRQAASDASTGSEPPKPEFKGYPSTLERSEALIGQVKRYGMSEGLHATSMDAADRRDTQEIWCSGLSNWALAEAGFDLDAPIPGKTRFEKKKRLNKKTGQEEWVTVERPVTIRDLVEGRSRTFADRKEEAKEGGESEGDYAEPGLFGATPADDDPRVKGAAGAFVLAGIGQEILDLEDVKPGDFAQTRAVGSPVGHAFQIHACLCEGECLEGPAGAPTAVKDLGGEVIVTAEGTWYGKASFRIDGKTDPRHLGMHKVVKSDWLEANGASKMEDKSDKDGGVQIRHGAKFEDPTKGGKRTYIGRLNGSSWTGFSRHDPPLKKPETAALAPEAA